MGWFEIGLTAGYLVYAIFLGLLIFSKKFTEWFYINLLEDTILGSTGQFLYYPEEDDDEAELPKRLVITLTHILLHLLIFAIWTIVFLLIGAILAPFIVLGIILSPLVFWFSKRKKKV